MEELLFKTS